MANETPCTLRRQTQTFVDLLSLLFIFLCEPENCPRLRIEVHPTAFGTQTLTLTLTSDLDLQSDDSCGHGPPYKCKGSRSEITKYNS